MSLAAQAARRVCFMEVRRLGPQPMGGGHTGAAFAVAASTAHAATYCWWSLTDVHTYLRGDCPLRRVRPHTHAPPPDYEQVTNFLGSPDTAREFSGFHSVANALRWAHDVVKGDGRYGRAHAIQTVAVVGTDDDAAAVVVMTKHRGMNMQRLALYKAEAEELAELQALLG